MKRFTNPILVTRPYLPDLAEFKSGIDEVWQNQWLTNNGPMLQRFQRELAAYLNVPETNLALFVNGTLALELGFQAMGLAGGDVITTPFTFVATSHALKRIGATPVFADIDPETLCLDPAKVEPLITSRTKAIVPVHVYGNVCDIAGFDRLSKKYGIPVIYDAAHAFGVTQPVGASVPLARNPDPTNVPLNNDCGHAGRVTLPTIATCGAMSMFSFHPTKLFHSCEGGLLVFNDPSTLNPQPSTSPFFPRSPRLNNSLQSKLFELRNFAIHSETECTDVGSNAKMNELQALMGLCCLKHMDELLAYRQSIYDAYAEILGVVSSCSGRKEEKFQSTTTTSNYNSVRLLPYSQNHAYVPVLFKTPELRERVYTELRDRCNVYSRRYFYPLLTDFAPYVYARNACPIARDIASRVLTLPTYYGLPMDDVRAIAQNVLEIVQG